MIDILLCGIRTDILEQIQKDVQEFVFSTSLDARIHIFENSKELFDKFSSTLEKAIVVLGIFPNLSEDGILVAQKIHAQFSSVRFVFVSDSGEGALDAFSLEAVHFLVTPFSKSQFVEAMTRAVLPFRSVEHRKIALHCDGGTVSLLDASQIIYIESVGYSRVVHTEEGEIAEKRRTLGVFFEELCAIYPGQFILPYRGYIVNLQKIQKITQKNLILENGETILIKRGDFRKLRETLLNWIAIGGNMRGGYFST